MTNTSASGGFLAPTGGPIEDLELDVMLQRIVVGITGMEGKFVRPRWQAEPGNLPPREQNWAAVGVIRREADAYAAETHESADDGSDIVTRHERLDLLCSFYGPNCQANGAVLRDGLSVAQNREALKAIGMELVSVGDLERNPELIKGQWYGRADLPVILRRAVQRTYRVLNLLSAEGDIASDGPSTPFNI